jgi:hypothetical protein
MGADPGEEELVFFGETAAKLLPLIHRAGDEMARRGLRQIQVEFGREHRWPWPWGRRRVGVRYVAWDS